METSGTAEHTLTSLLYRSRATVPMREHELDALVDAAKPRNHKKRITGALFCEQGRFFQWLEGPKSSVTELFDTIQADPRHTDVKLVSAGRSDTRVFKDWDLRFYRRRMDIVAKWQLTETFGFGGRHSIQLSYGHPRP